MKKQFLKTIFTGLVSLFLCNYTYGQNPVSISPSNVQPNIPCTFTYNGNAGTPAWFIAEQGVLNYPLVSYGFVGNGNSLTHSFAMSGTYFVITVAGNDSILTTVFVNEPSGTPKSGYEEQNCNIISNYSFENYSSVPSSISEITKAVGWYDARDNYATSLTPNPPYDYAFPFAGTSDFYHLDYTGTLPQNNVDVPLNSMGTENASIYYEPGQGYAGIFTKVYGVYQDNHKDENFKEYLLQKLVTPMIGGPSGSAYTVRFFVSLAEGSKLATSIGALFTTNEPNRFANTLLSQNITSFSAYIPQVSSPIITTTNGWTEVSGIVNVPANVTYNYITIGNFNNGANTISQNNIGYNATHYYSDDNSMARKNAAVPQQNAYYLLQSFSTSYYYIDEVTVIPHTCCITDKSFGTDLNSVTYTSQLNMSPGQSASIIGNLVVNSPVFMINNLNLKFAPGSKLTVPAGTKLNIAQGSVLEACTEMWEGIFAPGELFLYQGTVRDAKSALNFTNTSKWNVQMSVLENNRRHMLVNNTIPATGFTSSYFKDNILRCNPAQMKPPFAGQYTYNAIELYNIRTIFIGRTGPAADRNEISDAVRGIYAEKALALYVQNNHFENIGCHGIPCGKFPDLGVAVMLNAQKLTDPLSTLYAGINGNPSGRNTFNNCRGGIYAFGNVNTQAYMNQMSYITDYGIFTRNGNKTGNGLTALQNQITHAKTGIYAYNPGNRPVMIFGNIIRKLMDFNTVPTYGIRVENPLASSQPYAVFVNANEVWQYRFGIHLSQITTPQVMNNLVNTHAHITSYPEGIRVNYCPKAHIAENNIYEYGAGIGQSMGIRVEYSATASTLCNNIHSNQISMFFGGNQPTSTVGANYMHNGKQGIFLNYGNIGRQGENNVPHLNAWIGNSWDAHFVTSGQGTGGTWSRFQLKWPGSIFFPSGLTSIETGGAWPIQAGIYAPQGAIPGFVTNCRGNLDDQAGMVEELYADSLISDSLEFRTEAKWAYDYQLYRTIKEDTTGMLDAALYQYKAALEQTTLGRLEQAKDSAINTKYTEALVTLNTVNDTLEIESKLKTVLGFYFEKNMQADSTIELSEAEIQVLTELAVECPYKYGEAVYTARNILYGNNPDTLYVNSCEESYLLLPKSLKEQESVSEEEQELFVIYPNPSAGEFALVFETVEEAEKTNAVITDLYGRKMGDFTAYRGSDMILIPADALPKGVYFCTVYQDGVMIETKQIQKL